MPYKDPEARKAYAKAYRERSKNHAKAYMKEYRRCNKVKIAEGDRNRRELAQAKGICSRCFKRPARKGKVNCAACSADKCNISKRQYKNDPKYRQYILDRNQKTRDGYAKTGRCRCSRPLHAEIDRGYKTCIMCRTGLHRLHGMSRYIPSNEEVPYANSSPTNSTQR